MSTQKSTLTGPPPWQFDRRIWQWCSATGTLFGLSLLVAADTAWAVPANATSVLWVGGTSGSLGGLIPQGTFGSTDRLLGGAYKDDPLTTVDYPASIWPVTGLLDLTLGESVGISTTKLESAVRVIAPSVTVASGS